MSATLNQAPISFKPDEFCLTILAHHDISREAAQSIHQQLIAPLNEFALERGLPGVHIEEWRSEKLGAVLTRNGYSLLTLGFRIGEPFDRDPAMLDKRNAQVVQLINALNAGRENASPLTREMLARVIGLERIAFAVAVPNLLTKARSVYTGGGPGSEPEPVDPILIPGMPKYSKGNFGQFFFPDQEVKGVQIDQQAIRDLVDPVRAEGAQPSGVTVAVLDTWPDTNRLTSQFPTNVVPIVGPNDSYGIGLNGLPPRPIADHGLFVAGIIKDIAPTATIQPVRVLDQHGVGTLNDLVAGLAYVEATCGTPLVVNLSLGLLGEEEWRSQEAGLLAGTDPGYHLGTTIFDAFSALNLVPDNERAREIHARARRTECHLVRAMLYHTFLVLAARTQTIVVAAAGNDADGLVRPDPDIPARYESVISVGAVNAQEQPSRFSNLSNVRNTPINGIAVLGGDITGGLSITTHRGAVTKKDAIVGLYSAGFGVSHKEGWAYWAGTSFAAPIISALAADIWASNSGATAQHVKHDLLALGRGKVQDLDCQLIIAEQDVMEP